MQYKPLGSRPSQPTASQHLQALVLALATGCSGLVHAQLKLEELIATTESAHPAVAVARGQLEVSTADLASAKLQRFPTPSVEFSGANRSTLRVDQPLWTAGRITANIEEAESRVSAARSRIGVAALDSTMKIIDAWQQVVSSQERLRVINEGLKLFERYENLIARRVSSQASPPIEVQVLQGRLLQTRVDASTAKSAKQIALARLELLTNRQFGDTFIADEELQSRATAARAATNIEPGFGRAIADADPSVQAARFDVEAQQRAADAARAATFPNLILRAQQDRSNGVSNNGVFLTLQYAPGAGLSSFSQANAAAARINAANAGRDLARLQVMESILAETQLLSEAAERESTLLRAAEGAAQVLDSYERQFAAGRRGWQDVVNAARELIQYQVAAADARSQMVGAAAKIQTRRVAVVN
jgi:adhesin transport system outer membrane protein